MRAKRQLPLAAALLAVVLACAGTAPAYAQMGGQTALSLHGRVPADPAQELHPEGDANSADPAQEVHPGSGDAASTDPAWEANPGGDANSAAGVGLAEASQGAVEVQPAGGALQTEAARPGILEGTQAPGEAVQAGQPVQAAQDVVANQASYGTQGTPAHEGPAVAAAATFARTGDDDARVALPCALAAAAGLAGAYGAFERSRA